MCLYYSWSIICFGFCFVCLFKWDRSLTWINFHLHFGLIQTAAKLNWFLISTHCCMFVEGGESIFWFLFMEINLLSYDHFNYEYFFHVFSHQTTRRCCCAPFRFCPSSPFSEVPLGTSEKEKNVEKCWMFQKKQKLSHCQFLFCSVWSAKTGQLTENIYFSSSVKGLNMYTGSRSDSPPFLR